MEEEQTRPAPKGNKLTFIVFVTIFLFFLVLSFWMVKPYVLSILMGAILAILSLPLHHKLMERGIGRRTSALLVTIILIVAVIGPIASVTFMAIEQGVEFTQKIAREGGFNVNAMIDRVASWGPVSSLIGSPEDLKETISAQLQTIGAAVSSTLLAVLSGLPDKILQGVLALLAAYFFLADGGRFIRWLNDKLPLDRDVRGHLYGAFQETTISTIWATLAAAASQALVMYIAFLVLGLNGKFLAAAATFFFAWIPFIGSTPVWAAGAIILATQDAYVRMVLMLGFGAFCGIVDNIVRPWVLKGRGGLHPLVSLVAIFGAIQMFGLFGVFFGPILVAVLLSLFQVWPVVAKRFNLIQEQPATGPAEEREELLRHRLLMPRGLRTRIAMEQERRARGSRNPRAGGASSEANPEEESGDQGKDNSA